MSFSYDKGMDWMRDLLEIAYKFDFIHRVNNVTYSLVNLETGEIYKDSDGNELTGKRKVLEDYLMNNYDFQNEYLGMLHRFISASDNTYGNILDEREQAEISKEEAAVEKGSKQSDGNDSDSDAK